LEAATAVVVSEQFQPRPAKRRKPNPKQPPMKASPDKEHTSAAAPVSKQPSGADADAHV